MAITYINTINTFYHSNLNSLFGIINNFLKLFCERFNGEHSLNIIYSVMLDEKNSHASMILFNMSMSVEVIYVAFILHAV